MSCPLGVQGLCGVFVLHVVGDCYVALPNRCMREAVVLLFTACHNYARWQIWHQNLMSMSVSKCICFAGNDFARTLLV